MSIAKSECRHPIQGRVMYHSTAPGGWRYLNGKTGCVICGRVWGTVGTRKLLEKFSGQKLGTVLKTGQ